MLKKSFSDLAGVDLDEFFEAAKRYYTARGALQALEESQEKFREAVAAGAFAREGVALVLHELDDLAQSYRAPVPLAFERFQALAFRVLGQAMPPGFRNEVIEVTGQPIDGGVSESWPPYRYARIDVDINRWTHARHLLVLHISEDVELYGGPFDLKSGNKMPSHCRNHHFQTGFAREQGWTWRSVAP